MFALPLFLILLLAPMALGADLKPDAWHVRAGESIQETLELAANSTNKVVKVHAGTYAPESFGPASIWFNRKHDGIQLKALGEVILTAENARIAPPDSPAGRAVVNHIVYFGEGVSERTVLEGFTLSGANHFVTTNGVERIEPSDLCPKGLFFYCDGGAIKVFGQSYPTLRGLEVVNNYASPCAGGISVEACRAGAPARFVTIENCVFRNNRAQITGAAIDLLEGSAALIRNCLFVANAASEGVNFISPNTPATEFTNSAALTVFPGARAIVRDCTFTGNRNAVDDFGTGSEYVRSLFWKNDLAGGFYTGQRYEAEIRGRAEVTGCFFGGKVFGDAIDGGKNVLEAEDPKFDARYVPTAKIYENAGYRPGGRKASLMKCRFSFVIFFCALTQVIGQNPETARVVKYLQRRQAEETSQAETKKAFHGFSFDNRVEQSQITFKPDIADDVGKYNHPIHYDHGTGLAVADVDGDKLPDLYFVGQLGGNQLWKNLGSGRFENITAAAGVGLSSKVCVAASFADIDNDGDADLFVTTVRNGNVLLENVGNGRFKDISGEAGVAYAGHSSGATFFDYDNDGLLDLFVANVGKYTLEEKGRGGAFVGMTNSFHGHLYPQLSEASLLYRNGGGKKFKLVSPGVLSHTAWSGEASFHDVNGDGFADLYVCSMQGDDKFYENQGGVKFVEKTARYFPKTPWGAMGSKFFDYNNDGLMDLFVTDMHSDMTSTEINLQKQFRGGLEKAKSEAFCALEWTEEYLQGSSNNIFGNAFYQNLGGGKFAEVSDHVGVETFWPWGASAGDFNADGFQDLFVTAGMGYPFQYYWNSLLLNEGGRGFFDAEFVVGIEPRKGGVLNIDYFTLDCDGADKNHPICEGQRGTITIEGTASSRSSAVFDLDNDGDLDVVTNELLDRPQIFISNLNAKKRVNFLKVELKGTKSNADGLGATVTVRAGSLVQSQYHDGKSGYMSQSSGPLYFGLADATAVERIEVKWPSGSRQVVTNSPVNRLVRIVE